MRTPGLAVCCVLLACGTRESTAPPGQTQHVDRVEAPSENAPSVEAEKHLIAMSDELKTFITESQGPIESGAVDVLGRALVMKLLAALAARNRCLY